MQYIIVMFQLWQMCYINVYVSAILHIPIHGQYVVAGSCVIHIFMF
jgi:hypothetical protein